MPLIGGARIGPFEIGGELGAGGMGQVFRARDTRLKRDVALKVLGDAVAADPDRIARFQREAELLATLMHQHIAAIHGIEDLDGTRALVLELVEGETLADRLRRGPLPLDEGLAIARQLADALDYAHERGILHRDLKPANIKVTPDGRVKLLDFGLAKALDASEDPGGADPAVSPTVLSPAVITGSGVILGTAAYMSPEQARGQRVDRRADVWAFGCVLFEMLSGTRAFGGDTVSDTLAAVLRSEPEWQRLPASTPPRVVTLLKRCLARDPRARLRDIGDARYELDVVGEDGTRPTAAATPRFSPAWVVAALAVAGAAAVALSDRRPPPTVGQPLVQIESEPLPGASILSDTGPAAVLSPDGAVLAFAARPSGQARQLFVRRLNDLRATALADTTDARDPFFSPAGDWIAFFAEGKLKKVPTVGGAVVTVCDAPNGRGGSWGDDGQIVFNPRSAGEVPLHRVAAAGGVPAPLFALADGDVTQRWPQVLPQSRGVLYTAATNLGNYNNAAIVVQSPGGAPKILLKGGYFGRYLPSGHLVFVRDGRLFAQAFDLDGLALSGEAVPVLDRLATASTPGTGQIAFSSTGTAVYLPRPEREQPLVWIDRAGAVAPLRLPPADWSNVRVSPDGRRLAFDRFEGNQTDVWVYDLDRDVSNRLTSDAADDWWPVWSPDGRTIAFRSARDRAFNLYWQPADGTGTTVRLTSSANPQSPLSWHPSGRLLLFTETHPQTSNDLMLLPLDGNPSAPRAGTPRPFLNSPAGEASAAFSPDGRWVAYSSDEGGRTGVYVRPFPGPGGQWLIAADGMHPAWSSDRRELLFLTADQRVMVAAYSTDGTTFRPEAPRPWSAPPLSRRSRGVAGLIDGRAFDLHPDGRRIVAAPGSAASSEGRVVFLFNLFDELQRLAPRPD